MPHSTVKGVLMVEIIEVDGWSTLSDSFVIDVLSLEDLKKIAVRFGIPYIFNRRREYIVVCDSGSALLFYRFSEKHEMTQTLE